MMIIYRVENGQGEGMYSGANNAKRYMCGYYDHPEPYRDEKLITQICLRHPETVSYDETLEHRTLSGFFVHENFIFGFASIEQLKRWISETEWREDLEAHCFRISVYECEEAYCGYSQAVIMKTKKRELLYKLSLLEV